MPDDNEEWPNIKEELLKEFDIYNTTVDIVSCWEAFIDHSFEGEIESYNFDRFPSISHPENYREDLTPDFTISFNQEYGIIGEIKRTFPEDEKAFVGQIEQILTYDDDLQIEMEDGSERVLETLDLLLLIEGTDAPQISQRILDLREEGTIDFENNFLMFRYNFNQTSTFSRYEFQKVIEVSDTFRDKILPKSVSLSRKFDEERDTLKVFPKHFVEIKFEKPICNDEPPPHYLATLLWHRIFAGQISESDYRDWQWGSAQKIKSFTVEPYEFTREVNKKLKCEGDIRVKWVKDAFDFLCETDLAEYDEREETYDIKFRDFNIRVGEEGTYQDGMRIRKESKELTYKLIKRYEKKLQDKEESDEEEGESPKDSEKDEGQVALTDFS